MTSDLQSVMMAAGLILSAICAARMRAVSYVGKAELSGVWLSLEMWNATAGLDQRLGPVGTHTTAADEMESSGAGP